MVAIVMWIAIAAISISAIWAGTYSKNQKSAEGLVSNEEVKMLVAQNKEMKERLENLEAIITNLDEDLLLLNAVPNSEDKDKVKRLAKKMQDRE